MVAFFYLMKTAEQYFPYKKN